MFVSVSSKGKHFGFTGAYLKAARILYSVGEIDLLIVALAEHTPCSVESQRSGAL